MIYICCYDRRVWGKMRHVYAAYNVFNGEAYLYEGICLYGERF